MDSGGVRLHDQHVHSTHSHDSPADPAACVLRAKGVGLAGLTFTEHYDTHPEEASRCIYDDEAYTRTIDELRERFGGSIWIGKGIEVDYQPATLPAVVDFLGQHSFDVVLLGVHYARGEPVFDSRAWQGNDPTDLTRRYLETVLEALEACEKARSGQWRPFDVLAHLDFVKRYALQFTGTDRVAEQVDLLDEILQACLGTGVIPELNTSTLRKGYREGMPGPAVIRRYAELGGEMMVTGSDSHRIEEVGSGLKTAEHMLREAGIRQIAVFEKRVCRTESLAPPQGQGDTP